MNVNAQGLNVLSVLHWDADDLVHIDRPMAFDYECIR